ncbi:enoyl-CoA hydratase [Polymorphobacter glacialis]|uniref:Enoyl-CoA hydratase n=1 Tax=Sandarakinorhabdus glacialis TaxID=1614636 RepID=A0A916ZTE9_9SPHN|nr:enoyl-CoA hydratase [Polymorphobacter glacialis]GGE13014.1 enoyl-CoA hydratase [Polymorphobacter glacialis]
MSQDVVIIERDGPVATVTLNRPDAMNALSRAMRSALAAAMRDLEADENIRVVVLTGSGDRAFTAGLDLKELGSEGLGAANAAGPDDNPVKAIELLTKPCVGAINGVAITGGFELALACDVLIASDRARFADTHARVGIMPGWGLSQKLSRLIGPYRARELSLTGNFLDAATACAWGLVNRVVAPHELLPIAQRLAADMATIDPAFSASYKSLINDGYGMTFLDGMALEAQRSIAANSKVSADAVETARAAVQARGRSQ